MRTKRNLRNGMGNIDLTKGTVPVVIVASLLAFMTWTAYALGAKVKGFEAESVSTNQRFEGVERELGKIRELLERTVYVKPSEFRSWCAVTESMNKGWKCGEIDRLTIR